MMQNIRRLHTFSSPTCEDLGLPRDAVDYEPLSDDSNESYSKIGFLSHDPSDKLNINGLRYEPENPNNPFSPYCRIPLPNPYGCYEYGMEPAFIRKRNERERERVRCVNDGYARLREHLPVDQKPEKRISKVETLRGAIRYIKQLQHLLERADEKGPEKTSQPLNLKKRTFEEVDTNVNNENIKESTPKKRACSSIDGRSSSRRS